MSIDDERRKDALIERLQLRFESVRERVNNALADIEKLKEIRVRRWVCRRCQHEYHFTKPMGKPACDPCPKCHGTDFAPG